MGLPDAGISRENFDVFFEHAGDGMIISEPNTHEILAVNPRMCRMFGYTREEFKKIGYFDLSAGVPPFTDADVLRELENTSTEDDVPPLEWLGRRKNRELFWVEINRRRFHVDGTERILAIVRDIDIRKKAERARLRYEELYESSLDGYALISLDYRFLEFNSSYMKLLGYDREELLGMCVADITPKKWQFIRPQTLSYLRERGYSDTYEKEYIRKDGTLVPVEIRTYLYRNERGEPAGYWGFVRDISEQKRSHAALAGVRSRNRAILEAIPDLIFEMDSRGVFTGHRGKAEDMVFPPEAFIGKGVEALFPEEIGKKTMEYIRLALETGTLQVYEYGMPMGDGERFFEARMIAVDDDNIIAIVRDITERKSRMDALIEENRRLQIGQKDRYRFAGLIGKSESMQRVYRQIAKVAASDAGVIIYGETGTGKDLAARAIHDMSAFGKKRFVPVNCGAIPEQLAESQFFGHRKGAFSGAETHKEGLLPAANGGTLFLDEVGEISLNLQVKLLRAVETGEFTPVGSHTPRKSSFRLVAATNRNLAELVKEGKVREDFFFRIHVLTIELPPLRERKEDIPLLSDHFLKKSNVKGAHRLNARILDAFHRHHWPGNVRELNNVLQRYYSMGEIHLMNRTAGGENGKVPMGSLVGPGCGRDLKSIMERVEKDVVDAALREAGGKRVVAAASLGIDRKTLYEKMKRHGIK